MNRPTIAGNVMWNWAGMAANVLVGFAIAPFLVNRLGQTSYGLWILVASFIYYLGLLDLGVRGAVGRQIALFLARKDHAALNATLSTALAVLTAGGAAAFVGMLGVTAVFFGVFEVPPEQMADVRLALILVGLNLLLWLPLNAFDATLWAYQRFDLLNIVDISSVLTRLGLTLYWIGHADGGLVALAVINLLTLSGAQAIKGIIVLRLDRELRVGVRLITREAARGLLGIGAWNTVLSLGHMANGQLAPMIVGSYLTVALVTPYSVAARLVTYGREFLVVGSGVLTPLVIGYHAQEQRNEERQLLLRGGKYCLGLALFFLTLFVVLGEQVIQLWMGPELAYAYLFLVILALGEALPMSQLMASTLLLGKYRHRVLGWASIVENVLAIGLALLLVRPYGLLGVCVAFSVPGTLCRGVFPWMYGCWLVQVPLRRYADEVLLPVLATAALPALLLVGLIRWHQADSWLLLVLYTGAYGVAFLVVFAAVVDRACIAPLTMRAQRVLGIGRGPGVGPEPLRRRTPATENQG